MNNYIRERQRHREIIVGGPVLQRYKAKTKAAETKPAVRPIACAQAPYIEATRAQAPTARPISACAEAPYIEATPAQAPTARSIPAWGEAPCAYSQNRRGLKARPINLSADTSAQCLKTTSPETIPHA
jgi:hypothetical protein